MIIATLIENGEDPMRSCWIRQKACQIWQDLLTNRPKTCRLQLRFCQSLLQFLVRLVCSSFGGEKQRLDSPLLPPPPLPRKLDSKCANLLLITTTTISNWFRLSHSSRSVYQIPWITLIPIEKLNRKLKKEKEKEKEEEEARIMHEEMKEN